LLQVQRYGMLELLGDELSYSVSSLRFPKGQGTPKKGSISSTEAYRLRLRAKTCSRKPSCIGSRER